MKRLILFLALAGSLPAQYLFTGTATVQTGQASGTQTNFPALIVTTQNDFRTVANGGKIQNTVTQTVGNRTLTVPADLVLASDVGCSSLYSWEFESYDATTGAAVVWVKVGSIADGTIVHICYDNASVNTLQTTPTSTWPATVLAAYHLVEDPSGSAPQLNDSTANANHATTVGSMTSGEQAAGKIGGSIAYNGTTQYSTVANPTSFQFLRTDSWSVSVWLKMAGNTSSTIFGKFDQPATPSGWETFQRAGSVSPTLQMELQNGVSSRIATHTTTEFSAGVFHHVVWTYAGTSLASGVTIYVDGVSQSKTNLADTLSTNSATNTTGVPTMAARWNSGTGTTPATFNGATFDEMRIYAAGTVLSSGWVTTEYNNQNAPNTFFTVSVGTPPTPIPVGQGGKIME